MKFSSGTKKAASSMSGMRRMTREGVFALGLRPELRRVIRSFQLALPKDPSISTRTARREFATLVRLLLAAKSRQKWLSGLAHGAEAAASVAERRSRIAVRTMDVDGQIEASMPAIFVGADRVARIQPVALVRKAARAVQAETRHRGVEANARSAAEYKRFKAMAVRDRVVAAWRASALPERARSMALAIDLGMTQRQVQDHVKKAGMRAGDRPDRSNPGKPNKRVR